MAKGNKKDSFYKHFGCNPSKFKSDKAVSIMMQLPVAVFSQSRNGGQKLYVCELWIVQDFKC